MDKRIIRLIVLSCGAWSVLQAGHEIIGHGATVLLVGGKPISVNAMYFYYDLSSVTEAEDRWIRAGGSVFNILWAFTCLIFLMKRWTKNFEVSYFLWVSCILNFLQSGAYIAFGRFIDEGMDWAMVIDTLEYRTYWGYLTFIAGLLLISLGTFIAIKFAPWFLGTLKTRKKLYWIPLFSSTTLSVISSYIVPADDRFFMVMGGIGNGFTFLLPLFILGFVKIKYKAGDVHFTNNRSQIAVGIAFVISIFYLFFMSPGISFN